MWTVEAQQAAEKAATEKAAVVAALQFELENAQSAHVTAMEAHTTRIEAAAAEVQQAQEDAAAAAAAALSVGDEKTAHEKVQSSLKKVREALTE